MKTSAKLEMLMCLVPEISSDLLAEPPRTPLPRSPGRHCTNSLALIIDLYWSGHRFSLSTLFSSLPLFYFVFNKETMLYYFNYYLINVLNCLTCFFFLFMLIPWHNHNLRKSNQLHVFNSSVEHFRRKSLTH